MEKILIHLYVPALMRDYDLFVPQDVPCERLLPVLTDGLLQLSHGRYDPSGQEHLTAEGQKAPMQPDKTLADYGIRDGETLLLV